MYATFTLNVLIIGLVCLCVAWTGNPLFIMALLLLRDQPVFPPRYLVEAQRDDPDDDPPQPMGFTANVR